MNQILFLSTTNLHVRHGGALATLAYYNAFKQLLGERIELALPAEFCYGRYRTAIPIPSRGRLLTYFKFFQGRFHRYRDFFSNYLKINPQRYKIVILNGGFYAGDMIGLFHSYGIKIAVIHHNYEPEYHMDNKTLPTFYGITPYFIIKNERKAYLQADLNAFLTKADIDLHRKHYGISKTPPFLLGVFEPETVSQFPGEMKKNFAEIPNSIVITGSMNSEQTIQGIINFMQQYFPIVRNLLPNWKIIIAGRNPDQKILYFANQYPDIITVIPNPKHIDDVIAMGSIFLCPTHVGGGLKLRLMDGLRNGLPILTHSVSARGYDAFLGQPCFRVYNDKESFSKGLLELVETISKNKMNRHDICKIYRSEFSFEVGCNKIQEMLAQVDYR